MSDRRLRVALAALSAAGIAVTAYLLSARWGPAQLYCSTGGCETVQDSSYAEVLGVPVALLALLGWVAIGLTALGTAELVRMAGAAVALAGLAFAAYLLVVQLFVLEAVCDWCLTTDVLLTLATVVAVLRLRPPVARAV
jgi:uncharacterized membrane protein